MEGRVLVADDEKVNVEFFQVMLSKLGFEVEVAYNGEEVLEKVRPFQPDVLLLDLLMPRLNGFQVTQRLQQDEATKNIPIIVLSAMNDIDKKVDMFELGIYDYIIKPFNFIEILSRIRSAVRYRRLRQELAESRKKLASLQVFERDLHRFIETARLDSRFILTCLETRAGADGDRAVDPGKGQAGGSMTVVSGCIESAAQGESASEDADLGLDAVQRGLRLIESICRLEDHYAKLMG